MPGFDEIFYLEQNPDVRAAATDPLKHYLEWGWKEGREPSAGFKGQLYLALHPDVQAAGVNPLVHFLEHGLAEGRHWLIQDGDDSRASGTFDRLAAERDKAAASSRVARLL